jgi:hypothetical protein
MGDCKECWDYLHPNEPSFEGLCGSCYATKVRAEVLELKASNTKLKEQLESSQSHIQILLDALKNKS